MWKKVINNNNKGATYLMWDPFQNSLHERLYRIFVKAIFLIIFPSPDSIHKKVEHMCSPTLESDSIIWLDHTLSFMKSSRQHQDCLVLFITIMNISNNALINKMPCRILLSLRDNNHYHCLSHWNNTKYKRLFQLP